MTIADVVAARTGHDGTVAASDGPPAGRPKRRIFTAEYKLRILEEYENAEIPRDRDELYVALAAAEERLGRPVQATIRDPSWLDSGTGAFHDTVTSRPMLQLTLTRS